MANNADIFAEALQKLNEEHDAKGVNTPTRVTCMLQASLLHADAFKIANTVRLSQRGSPHWWPSTKT